ncbi:endonuclease/exonuclease/phosphatase family protein [Streptomyces sp. NPDC058603]|uniref:endonuclease/exonuclease/phosphatase family protein n=1 Tax=Streptomyces sp. NPDC058603 TaxID=3346551 RepID=UPI003667D746
MAPLTPSTATKQPLGERNDSPPQGSRGTPLRAVVWNLFGNGVDGSSEERLMKQADILRELDADIFCLPECTRWDEDDERRLWWVANTLRLRPVAMVRSRLGTPVQNHTVLMYRPSTLRLIGRTHPARDRARLRPFEENDDRRDFFVLGTHLSDTGGETRLREARWMTDYAGEFLGMSPAGLLLADLNVPDREPQDGDWSLIPRNLHSRYRFVREDGSFGGVDRRAPHVLLACGWVDPQTITGGRRAPTVGYFYENEPVPWCLDYALVTGMDVTSYRTHYTPRARTASDHLPTIADVVVRQMRKARRRSLLCKGVLASGTGELQPAGQIIDPYRPTSARAVS